VKFEEEIKVRRCGFLLNRRKV